jgi:hypothetical protein
VLSHLDPLSPEFPSPPVVRRAKRVMVCHNPDDDHFIDSWRDRPVRCGSIWYDAAGGAVEASGDAAGVFLRAANS